MILVPYNFNATGENAIGYAIQIAQVVKLDVMCFHATESKLTSAEEKKGKSQEINQLIEKLNSEHKVNVSSLVVKGNYEEEIEKYSIKNQIEVVIVGTRKVNGFGKMMMESRTSKFLNGITLPIFIVPEDYKYKSIDKILWASDMQPINNDDALDPVVALAKVYDAEVRIAHVKTSSDEKIDHNEMSRQDFLFSDGVKHSFKKIRRSSVSKGIRHYLSIKGDNDVLVLVKRKHGLLDSLFKKENSLEFALNPELPIFILHEDGRKMKMIK